MEIMRKRGEVRRFGTLSQGTVFNDGYLKASIWDPVAKEHVSIYVELKTGTACWAGSDGDWCVIPNPDAMLVLEGEDIP